MLRASAATVALCAGLASAQFQATSFSGSLWRISDAVLGISGLQIENFEDTQLLPRLSVGVVSNNGLLAPTTTLPNLMVAGPDPFGTAFSNAAWDGTRILINTRNNQAQQYDVPGNWGDLTLRVNGGTDLIGFSIQQLQHTTLNRVLINGQDIGSFAQFIGLPASASRNGYTVIRALDPDNLIRSLTITAPSGDGFAIDHLAIGNIPAPASVGLLALAGGWAVRRRRLA